MGGLREGSREQHKTALQKFRREEVQPRLREAREDKWWEEHGKNSGRHEKYYSLRGGAAGVAERLAGAGATGRTWNDFAEWGRVRFLWASNQERKGQHGWERLGGFCADWAHEARDGEEGLTASPEHLITCPGNTTWREDVVRRMEGGLGEEPEDLVRWTLRADLGIRDTQANVALWGAIVRKQKANRRRRMVATEERNTEAELERVWAAFVDWVNEDEQPWAGTFSAAL